MGKQIISSTMGSRWVVEKGRWDEDAGTFLDRTEEEFIKMIEAEVYETDSSRLTLEFLGGPTGFESYYLGDLVDLKDRDSEEFCICAGTINRWPACYVKRIDVVRLIDLAMQRYNLNQ